MGQLLNGTWTNAPIVTANAKGAYERKPRGFRDHISEDNPTAPPMSGRYHLYVSYACPWATRTLIARSLLGLKPHISVDVVHPHMLDDGWMFSHDFPGTTGDTVNRCQFLRELYLKADPHISTSVTVPILWDKHTHTIVNNESSDILRMFNSGFNRLTGNTLDLYPTALRQEIDQWNDTLYHGINNSVYKAGFAKTQAAYEEALDLVFRTLDTLERHFNTHAYLVGNTLSEADLRLIPTLLRFDLVYHTHFKCNKRMLAEYPNIKRMLQQLYALPAVSENHFPNHIKAHYYYSHRFLNPHQIVAKGPERPY